MILLVGVRPRKPCLLIEYRVRWCFTRKRWRNVIFVGKFFYCITVGFLPINNDFGGQRCCYFFHFLLGVFDGFQGVRAISGYHDAACGIGSIHIDHTTPHIGAKLDGGDLSNGDRGIIPHSDNGITQVIQFLDISSATEHVFDSIDGEVTRPCLHVALTHGIGNVGKSDIPCLEFDGIDLDLVLLDEATNGGDFRDPLGRE